MTRTTRVSSPTCDPDQETSQSDHCTVPGCYEGTRLWRCDFAVVDHRWDNCGVQTLNFAKGHGTHNDFVILTDYDDLIRLDVPTVAWLCDRRGGIGGDGLLRAVRAGLVPEWQGDPDLWFMDYRNADGSIAEMCGNGLRVFVRHLDEQGLITTGVPVPVATRAGVRTGQVLPDGVVRISMGAVTLHEEPTWVTHDGRQWSATVVDVGNPHAVVFLDTLNQLRQLNLEQAPGFDPVIFPAGVNVEFAVVTHQGLHMRVFERGVGETMSCGTGVVATAVAHARSTFESPDEIRVSVPGGSLSVSLGEEIWLSGPAVVVAHGTVQVPEQGAR